MTEMVHDQSELEEMRVGAVDQHAAVVHSSQR